MLEVYQTVSDKLLSKILRSTSDGRNIICRKALTNEQVENFIRTGNMFVVNCVNGKLCGFASVESEDGLAIFNLICTEVRGGKAIIDFIVNACKMLYVEELMLHALNDELIPFYETNGFVSSPDDRREMTMVF
ncbi:hypothetical protein SARC_01582 [Sphaeroforma arctica JP610]|uniref:N-acetyltransferase domain-containing protein n=1 Tax=Sphaeroforma arctica JP610 TaxID=667725 RepID=A0A0L0GB83_9EUKA|nr:hypothetical protein SARC_01582 [Sphaeroforma arctica JP610]KNC86260.1 hypothetical protein SARC_01582 [Sphaeroforma arctica JP610]|eukprot:XP_014160162.1 hypothetical protein SARC_01582 [Sphaeroforma arctica JP610]